MRALPLIVLLFLAAGSPAAAGTLAFDAGECRHRDACSKAIWTVADDGRDLRRVTSPAAAGPYHDPGAGRFASPELDSSPSWTLDGKLVFARTERQFGNATRIYTVDPSREGSDRPAGIPGWAGWWSDDSPAASLVPGVLAFSSSRPDGDPEGKGGGPQRIWISTPAGARPLTPGILDERPTFSPDGLRVLFVRNLLPGVTTPTGVWSTTLAGGVSLPVVAGDDIVGAHEAAWSRDALRMSAQLPVGGLVVFRALRAPVRFGERWRFLAWGRGSRFFATPSGMHDPPPVVYELDADRPERAPREVIALPAGWHVGRAAWKPDLHEIVDIPSLVEPLLALTGDLPRLPTASASARTAASRIDPFAVMAADPDGIRALRASVGRAKGSRCRFLTARGRLSGARRCGRPIVLDASDRARWRRLTSRLPSGRYRLTVRARDRDGIWSKHPLKRAVRVR